MDYEKNYDYEGGTNVRSQYSNYITRKIREMYKKKLISPCAFLVMLIIIAIIHPVFNLILPRNIDENFSTAAYYENAEKPDHARKNGACLSVRRLARHR